MSTDRTTAEARMPETRLTPEMIDSMAKRAGTKLRIGHSVNNEEATRIAVAKFAAGIGDVNTLWTDAEHAARSPYGALVAPPSFVIGCFSGIQFGWPGLGAFHNRSVVTSSLPIYIGDTIQATCTYKGFSGPRPSRFAGDMVTDHFLNEYRNQGDELVATIEWDVVNFERAVAKTKRAARSDQARPPVPHEWTPEEIERIEAQALAERPRGEEPRYHEDIAVGDPLDILTKGPLGLTDEIAFVVGGGTPIPRLCAHAVALHSYAEHPAWGFRDPETGAMEPIYSVHYNRHAAQAMGVDYPYDVGFQRQAWQMHHLTHWAGDNAWIKVCESNYRRFVFLSDVIELSGEVVEKRTDDDGDHVVDIVTSATNQHGEDVMPGTATIALPTRADGADDPAARRAARRRAVATGAAPHHPGAA